jgi:hypothetical protein
VEFEISRADPVANHAKFATAHLFTRQRAGDSFVAMVSPHVARGRRNLAFNTITLMRSIGMSAFQTVLLPKLSPVEVSRLNALPAAEIAAADLPVKEEVRRLLTISEPYYSASDERIYYASDILQVLLNLRQFNRDMRDSHFRELFGRRTITFFVYDPIAGSFAPTKFCAFIPHPHSSGLFDAGRERAMSVPLYVQLDETHAIFDGHLARKHLVDRLGMTFAPTPPLEAFRAWLGPLAEQIRLHPSGPQFIVPPVWYR